MFLDVFDKIHWYVFLNWWCNVVCIHIQCNIAQYNVVRVSEADIFNIPEMEILYSLFLLTIKFDYEKKKVYEFMSDELLIKNIKGWIGNWGYSINVLILE